MSRKATRIIPGLLLLGATLSCQAWAADQDDLPLQLFSYDATQPLDVRLSPLASSTAALVYSISYASPDGGRVTGRLALPPGNGPFAGIVLLHGLPGTAEGAMANQGLELVAHGAVVLSIDAPWVRRGGLPDLTVRDSVEQVQLMKDLQRAVDVLLARTEVDPARLGYVGGSYGGAMGALFAGIERRLKAFVLFVPDGGLVAHFTTANGAALGPLAGLSAAERDRWLAAMRPIEPIRFVHRAPPADLLIQSGRQDQLVAVDDAEALHAAVGEPHTIMWYDAGHGLNSAARADRIAWIAHRLGMQP